MLMSRIAVTGSTWVAPQRVIGRKILTPASPSRSLEPAQLFSTQGAHPLDMNIRRKPQPVDRDAEPLLDVTHAGQIKARNVPIGVVKKAMATTVDQQIRPAPSSASTGVSQCAKASRPVSSAIDCAKSSWPATLATSTSLISS